MNLAGVHVPLVTPFDSSGDVDAKSIAHLVEVMLANNLSGIVAAGTTGEAYALTFEERRTVISTIVSQVKGRVPVLAGIGGMSTGEAIKQTIQENFREAPGGPKSWFNLNETNREAYDNGKLKKFLIQVKMMMQDTLLNVTKRSVKQFVEVMLKFLPKSVTVIDSNTVKNVFFTEEDLKADDSLKEP
jgi:hypothetical protein